MPFNSPSQLVKALKNKKKADREIWQQWPRNLFDEPAESWGKGRRFHHVGLTTPTVAPSRHCACTLSTVMKQTLLHSTTTALQHHNSHDTQGITSETICPADGSHIVSLPIRPSQIQKSRRIYICPQTGPQSAHLWWPAMTKLQAASVPVACAVGQTDGQIVISLNALIRRGGAQWIHDSTDDSKLCRQQFCCSGSAGVMSTVCTCCWSHDAVVLINSLQELANDERHTLYPLHLLLCV